MIDGVSGFGGCCLSFLVQHSLLSGWCLRLLSRSRFGNGGLGVLFSLSGSSGSRLGFHLLAGLADFLEAALLMAQLYRCAEALRATGSSLPSFPLP